MQLFSFFHVRFVRFFWVFEVPKVVVRAVFGNLRYPTLSDAVPSYASVPTGVVPWGLFVLLVLRVCCFSKIATSVVQRVAVGVVRHHAGLRLKDNTVHADSLWTSFITAPRSYCIWIPVRHLYTPLVRGQSFIVNIVYDRYKAFRQLDFFHGRAPLCPLYLKKM